MEAPTTVRISFDTSDETLRCSFVPHLSAAFGRKGISVFIEMLDEFYTESIASVLVFSENYVSSSKYWDKILKTNQWRHDKSHVVTTVFYGVSRSNVQELIGNFDKAFSGYRPSVSQWRNAIAEITSLPGHEASSNHSDCELVEKIAIDVYEKIFPTERIGIYTRMLSDIENLLCKQQWGIRSIGIWGMPGIGKTVLARALFDHFSGDYEVTCFVQNFHETFHEKGLYRLLLEHFKNLPNQTLERRALVILDDVRNHLDAESFLGRLVLFSRGSLVVITSRDKQVLSQCRVNQTYKVKGFKKQEALQLFSWCAFGRDVTAKNLLPELYMKAIEYANGNPLALIVYGEEMSSHEEPNKKESLFLKLKQAPPHQIIEVVKSSYDALSDNEKNILVYIAFFFTGENVNYVSEVLQDLGFFPHVGIDRLVENSLVTISENRLEMHNMIQAVVREIRRCLQLEIYEDLKDFKCVLGTEDIEAIALDASNLNPNVKLSSFGSMYNLRFLKICYSKPEIIGKALESLSLPYGLRFLHWEHYPLQTLPQDFDPSNLVEIDMPYSQLQTLWGGTKNLKMLKRINLRHSKKLIEAEELAEALNLEQIDLCGCENLQSFPAIHQLHKLRVVDLSGCTGIKIFPEFPSSVILKFHGTSVKSFSKPRKSEPPESYILDFLRLRSFFGSQERITNPESPPTFAMKCQKALQMSRSIQWKLQNLRIDLDGYIKPWS